MNNVQVGVGMSMILGSDCYPYVVTRKTKQRIFVRRVEHGKNTKQWPEQDFPIYLDQPYGGESMLTPTYYGWRLKGIKFVYGAEYHQDPSF